MDGDRVASARSGYLVSGDQHERLETQCEQRSGSEYHLSLGLSGRVGRAAGLWVRRSMRCSLCGRAAVRPMQLCPGCLAAIERAEERARKLDPLAAPRPGTVASARFEMPRSSLAARTSRCGIFSRPSHAGALVGAWLCTMLVFALPANLGQPRDALVPENTPPHTMGIARGDQTRVENGTQVNIADVRHERSAAALATPVLPAPSKATRQSASAGSPERPRAKLAQSSSPRHLPVAKSARLFVAQANPTRVLTVKPAPLVQSVPQTFAEAAVSTQPKRGAASHDIAVTAFNNAREQCAEQSVFVRTWCEHRARTRYCDAEGWTRPECAVAVNNEHGG